MKILKFTLIILSMLLIGKVFSHGDVTPQVVDTTELKPVGEDWLTDNPYSGNKKAAEVGSSAYGQNCARCHGLQAISGGIAPDLRHLDSDCMSLAKDRIDACIKENQEYFVSTVRKGRVRNGNVYMPPFDQILHQEAIWAIKTYLETVREERN